MKMGSLFAGIGGFDLGFERAGFEVAWCAEWDKNAQAVLRTRFPSATVYGDIRDIDLDALEPVDVICGGFPCQDLSVAGKRAGLAGARSGLFHDAMRIVRRLNPRVLVLENVPGLLSSNRGLDFATVLREVGEGWDCAEVGWRVLDSQYFGVAQRRRRVFVVAGSRTGCAESILALAEGGGGDPPTRGAPRQEAASDAARCFAGNRQRCATVAVAVIGVDPEHNAMLHHIGPLKSTCPGKSVVAIGGSVSHALTGEGHDADRVCIECGNDLTCDTFEFCSDCLQELTGIGGAKTSSPKVRSGMTVRRLTPTECERLQGFPDGWTQIGTNKPTADSHRYKQLGNAVTVNVAEWIARRVFRCLSS